MPISTITRRAALTGTAAGAAALAAGPALAGTDHFDVELFALGRQLDAIWAKIMEARRRMQLVAPPQPLRLSRRR